MKAAILAFMLLLGWIAPASASYVSKSSGLSVSKSGNRATYTREPGGTFSDKSDFEALLSKPAGVAPGGGVLEFERLLDNPFKPEWEKDPEKGKIKHKTPLNSRSIAKALRGGLVPYAAGLAFQELMEQACVRLAGGSMQMAPNGLWQECHMSEPAQPSTGQEYRSMTQFGGPAWSGWHSTREAACLEAFDISYQYKAAGWTITYIGSGGSEGCRWAASNQYNSLVFSASTEIRNASCPAGQYRWPDGSCRWTAPVEDVEWRDIPAQDAEDKIKDEIEKPGNGPKVAEALRDYWDKGGEVEPSGEPQVTGSPQSSPNSQTTTSTTTDPATGTSTTITTTTTTVNNYTYNNTTVINNQTTTTIKKNQDGEVIEETSTSTESSEGPPTDTPLPERPKLYERKYPEGIVGIWNEKSETIKQSPLFTLASQLMPTGINGGQCPSWQLDLDMAGFHNWGTHNVAPPCWIWDFGKVVVIIGALILARALIFGG